MKMLRKLKAYGLNLFGKGDDGIYERECSFALSDLDVFGGIHGNIRVIVGTEDEIYDKLERSQNGWCEKGVNLADRRYTSQMLANLSRKNDGRYVAFSSENGDLIHLNLKPIGQHDTPRQVASLDTMNTVYELSKDAGIKTYKRGEVVSSSRAPILNLRRDISPYESPATAL